MPAKKWIGLGAIAFVSMVLAAQTAAAERRFSFGYDQPHTTAYGFAADTFANKLKELSGGAMIIDQFPGVQLGQEPQCCKKSAPATSISSSLPLQMLRRSPPSEV